MLSQTLKPFRPITRNDKQIERSIGQLEGMPLVLFHKRGDSLIEDDEEQCVELLEKFDCGPVIEFTSNQWHWCHANPCNFNCHALAIGSAVGLTPEDWLEGSDSESTLHVNPAQLVLDAFYHRIETAEAENDVFVLVDSKKGDLIHSGFIREIGGMPLAISKFGEGPILATSFNLLSLVFSASYDEIRWYRLNERAQQQECEIEDRSAVQHAG